MPKTLTLPSARSAQLREHEKFRQSPMMCPACESTNIKPTGEGVFRMGMITMEMECQNCKRHNDLRIWIADGIWCR